MDISKIIASCDHTVLNRDTCWADVAAVCDDGVKYGAASVCLPPCYVAAAKEYTRGKIAVCTVIGFPNGYSSASAKAFETRDAVQNGADEIDMVVNDGFVRDGRYEDVLDEIRAVRAECAGKILKVIIETCLLDSEQKIRLCGVVTESGADYIKTSTGFAGAGATAEDIALMRTHVGPEVKIKAAGGISSIEDAAAFLEMGASRIGTSRIIKLVKENRSGEKSDQGGY